jgi:hypothetical protein
MTDRKRCPGCGITKPLAEFGKNRGTRDGRTSRCRDCLREGERHYRENNREAVHELNRIYRNEPANQKAKLAQQRTRRAANREAVLVHYSPFTPPRCACCGTTQRLTIDHISRGGRAHRQEIFGKPDTGGHHFYLWLVSHNFPPGYQVLCMSCNSSKGPGEHCRLNHAA